MNKQGEYKKIKRFLLENSSPQETEEIGVKLIADRSFADEVAFAEEELIEELIDNSLSDEEKQLFYENFLTTPERRELLEENALLRNYAQKQLPKTVPQKLNEKQADGFFSNFKNFLTLNLRPIAAVLIISILAFAAWRVLFYDANNLSPTEKEYAALNAKDLNNAPETENLSNKNLLAGTFRDNSETAKIKLAETTENILFRLALPSETAKETPLNLELVTNSKTVFRQNNLKIYQNQSGQELKVILPKNILTKGIYQIKLNSGATYGFATE